MSKYIWCEDRGSGFQFWIEIFKTLQPNAVVETKENNSRLRKAASAIGNDGNEYYILMDSFVDNADVLREIDGLRHSISEKPNVHAVDIRSFEFALLSFESLVGWVFAAEDELRDRRSNFIRAKELFIEQVIQGTDMEGKRAFETVFPYAQSHNNEQVATELLYQITRNTGFETTKSSLGDCFVVNCCEWSTRQSDDPCGLDAVRISADEKKRQIVSESILKSSFEKVGL